MATFTPRRVNSRSSSTHLIGWLGNDTQSASVLATAQLHLKIRAAVSAALPAAMRGAFDVVKIEQTALTLTVSSAAFAAKFRQMAPRVSSNLQTMGWNIAEIKLRVHGGTRLGPAAKPPREARLLDQQDLKAFEDLKQNLRPGPLADAVSKLLRHHQPVTGSQTVTPVSTLGETPAAHQPGKNK